MNIDRAIRFLRRCAALEISVYAANASFFILLSVFPAVMLLIGLLQYTPLSPDDLQQVLSKVLPDALQPLLDYMIRELFSGESAAALSFTAIAALWTATRGVYSFQRGINKVYRARETRNVLLVRLRCMLYTVLFLFSLIATAVLHLFERRLRLFLQTQTAPFFRVLSAVLTMKYVIVVCFLTAFFSVLYAVFPNRRLSYSSTLPGAFGAAVLWVVFSQLFSFYVGRFGNFSLYYGSLTLIALAMLWLYACMLFLFYGGLLNYELFRLREKRLS